MHLSLSCHWKGGSHPLAAKRVEQLTVPFNSNVSSRDGFSQISELHKCSIHHLCQGKAATATQLVQASLAKASPLYFF